MPLIGSPLKIKSCFFCILCIFHIEKSTYQQRGDICTVSGRTQTVAIKVEFRQVNNEAAKIPVGEQCFRKQYPLMIKYKHYVDWIVALDVCMPLRGVDVVAMKSIDIGLRWKQNTFSLFFLTKFCRQRRRSFATTIEWII